MNSVTIDHHGLSVYCGHGATSVNCCQKIIVLLIREGATYGGLPFLGTGYPVLGVSINCLV